MIMDKLRKNVDSDPFSVLWEEIKIKVRFKLKAKLHLADKTII